MINSERLAVVFESCCRTSRDGLGKYVDILSEQLGFDVKTDGEPYINKAKQRLNPRSFSIAELGHAFCGRTVMESLFNTPYGVRGGRAIMMPRMESGFGGHIGPSHFNQINAWLATTAGMLGAVLLEAYNSQEFIGDQLVSKEENVKVDQNKLVRVSPPTNLPDELLPGQQIPLSNLAQAWVTANKTTKKGQAVAVTREAIHFDGDTGAVVQGAEDIGYQLREDKEERIVKAVAGIENTYKYNDVARNTYLTTGAYTNSISNELVDETDLDLAEQQLLSQTDPETGRPIDVRGTRILFTTPAKALTAAQLANATQHWIPGANAATQTAVVPPTITGIKPLISQRLYNLLVASGVSTANAKKYWYWGDTTRAFKYREAWPLTTNRFSVVDSPMLALYDTVLLLIAHERGSVTTIEPRRVIRNTN